MWWLKGDGTTENNPVSEEDNGPQLLDSVAASELKEQFEQQEHLVQQLKDLLRQNEQQLREKEQTLEESASKLSKLKLQHKAKITQLTNQLQEAQRKSASSPVKQQLNDDEKIQETSVVDSSRGKVLMLKKQLEESRSMIEKRQQEMANSEQLLENLRLQLQERDQLIAQLEFEKAEANSHHVVEVQNASEGNKLDTDLKEMYAQIVYKDSKIMELDNRILELERNVIDLQEHVKEKEEVIQARNKAIQLLTEDLSRRGKVVVDQLDDTRDQMRAMQNNFVSMEDEWKKEKAALTEQFAASKALLEKGLADKEMIITDMQSSLSKLESVRFELSTRNAELQEKLVRLQDSIERSNVNQSAKNDADVKSLQCEHMQLREELLKKESLIAELQQVVGGSTKSSNQKLLKLKAQQKSQIKALEAQMEELKTERDSAQQSLQNRIADLEEEKGNLQLKLVDFDELVSMQSHQQKLLQELKEKHEQQNFDLDSHVKMISVLQKEKLDLVEQLTTRANSIKELEVEKSVILDELQSLRDCKISLEIKLVEVEESRDDAENSRQSLLTQIENLKTQLEEDRQPILEIEQQILDLRRNNQELVQRNAEMQEELIENHSAINTLKEELNVKNEEIQSLTEQINKNVARYQEIVENLNKKQLLLQQAINDNEELKLEKEQLNLMLKDKDEALLKLNEELHKLSSSNLEFSNDLMNKNELINKLTQEVTLLKESQNLEGRKVDNRVASLVEQLAEMETEIRKLQVSCQENEIQLETLRHEKDLATTEMNQWREMTIEKNREFEKILSEKDSEFAQVNEQLQNIVKEKDNLTNAMIVKEEQLTDAVNKLTALDDNMSKMAEQYQMSQSSILDLENKCYQLELVITDKNEEVKCLEIALQEKNVFCQQHQNDLEITRVDLVQSQKNLCDLSKAYQLLEENYGLLQQSKQEADDKLASLQNEIVSVTEGLVLSEQEVSHLREELNNSHNTVKSLEKKLQEEIDMAKINFESQILVAQNEFDDLLASKQECINQLSSKIERLQGEAGQQEIKMKQMDECATQLKSELESSNSQLEDLSNKIAGYESRESGLHLDISALKEENAKLLAEQNSSVVVLENLQKELIETKGEVEQASSSLELRQTEIENSTLELENMKLKLEDISNKLDLIKAEKDALANEKSILDKDLENQNSKIKELSSELEASRVTIIDLETELSELQQKCEVNLIRHDSEILQYKLSVSQLEDKVTNLRTQLQADEQKYRENVELLQLELQEKQNILADGTSSLTLALENFNSVQQEKAQIESEYKVLQQTVERLQFFETEFHKSMEMSSSLETKIQHLSDEKSRLEDRLGRLMEYNQQIEADLASTCESAKAAESENDAISLELKKKVRELEIMVSERDEEVANQSLLVESLNNEITSLTSEKENYVVNYSEIQTELLDLQEQCSLLNKKIETINLEHAKIDEEHSLILNNKEQAIQMLEGRVAELKDYKRRANELAETAESHFQEKQSLLDRITNLETTIEIANEVSCSATVDMLELHQKTLSLGKSNSDFIVQIANLQKDIHEKEVALEELNAVAKILQSKLNESLMQNQELNRKMQHMNEHIQGLQASSSDQVQSLSSQLDAANGEVQSLQAEVLSHTQLLKDAVEKTDEVSKVLMEKVAQLQRHEVVIQQLNDELIVKNAQLSEMENVRKENALLTERIEILEQNLEDAQQSTQELESLVSLLKNEKLTLGNNVRELHHETEELQNRIQEQLNQIQNLNISNEDLKLKLSVLEISMQEMQLKLQESNAHMESVQDSSAEKLRHLFEELEISSAEIQKLQSDHHLCASLKEEVELKNEKLESLELEIVHLQEELVMKNGRIKEIEIQMHKYDDKLQFLQSEILSKEECMSKLHEILQEKAKESVEHESCPKLMENVQEMLRSTELQLKSIQNENSSLQEKLQIANENTEKMAAYEAELADVKESLQQSVKKSQNLESSIKAFQNEIQMLNSQLYQDFKNVEDIDNLKTELQNVLESKKNLQKVVDESFIYKGQLEMQLAELQEKLDGQKVSNELTVAELNQEIERLIDDKRSLESKGESMELKLEVISSQNTEINQEIERLGNVVASMTQTNTELKIAYKTLQEEKQQLQHGVDDLVATPKAAEKTANNQLDLQLEMQKVEIEMKQLLEEKNLYQEQFRVITEDIGRLNADKLRLEKQVKILQADLQNATDTNEANRFQLEELRLENVELKNKYEVLIKEHKLLQNMEEGKKQLREMKLHDEHERMLLSTSTERLLGNSENSESLQSSVVPALNSQGLPDDSLDYQQFKNQMAVLQIKNEKMLAKLKIFKNKNDKLNLTLNDMATMQQSLTDEKMRLVEFNKRAQDEIKHLSNELRNLERLWKAEVKMLQDRLDTVEVANSKLVEIKEDLERKLIEQMNQNSDLQKEKEDGEKSISSHIESLENKHKEVVDQLKLKRDQLQRQVESLQTHNKFLESDNVEFQHLIEKLQVERSKCDHELRTQAEKYVPLMQEHSRLKEILSDLHLKDVTAIIDLKTNYSSLKKDYKDMLNSKAQLETEIEELRTELDAAVKDKARVERERDELRITLEETQVLITDGNKSLQMATEIQDLKSANAELCFSMESLQNELMELKRDEQLQKSQFGEPSEPQDSSRDDGELMNLEISVQDLKVQNADLLARISTLEGEIWRLEEEKQQIIEEATMNEQKSVRKMEADLEKMRLENTKLSEELESLDSDLKNVESEKEQIEAESRLTFQQQQETIKSLRNQLQHLEEDVLPNQNVDQINELQAELNLVKDELEKQILQLKIENEKVTHIETQNHILREKVIDLSSRIEALNTENQTLMAQIEGIQMEKLLVEQQLDQWKRQQEDTLEEEMNHIRLKDEMYQRMSQSNAPESVYHIEQERQKMKEQVAELQIELEHAIHSVHVKDVRCENLTSEITQLIEERDSLQLRLSSLLRADQQKEMRIKYLEMSAGVSGQLDVMDNDSKPKSPSNEGLKFDLDVETLRKRLKESDEKLKELHQVNAVLDQALVAERECRLKTAADLKFADEELAALGRGPKLKKEIVLSLDEDKVPLLPEHSQTLVRSYTGTTWRVVNWIQGRSLPRVLHV